MCACPHCGITNRQRENTTRPVVYQLRSAKRKSFWATPPCRIERYLTAIRRKKVYLAQLHINSAVYQPRSAKRKHTGAAIYQQQSEQQIDSTAGRHGRDCQSGILTAISKKKAYMAELFITNAVNQPQSATQKRIWRNCISIVMGKAK